MAKRRRVVRLDPLGDVRKAIRVLRHLELALVQRERSDKRLGEKRKAAFERLQAEFPLVEQG